VRTWLALIQLTAREQTLPHLKAGSWQLKHGGHRLGAAGGVSAPATLGPSVTYAASRRWAKKRISKQSKKSLYTRTATEYPSPFKSHPISSTTERLSETCRAVVTPKPSSRTENAPPSQFAHILSCLIVKSGFGPYSRRSKNVLLCEPPRRANAQWDARMRSSWRIKCKQDVLLGLILVFYLSKAYRNTGILD
jgi:hypothetical protein